MIRALAALLALSSCGGGQRPPPRPAPRYPGGLVAPAALRSPGALGDAFALEQRVRTEYTDGAREFRAVLQRRGGELLLVGLGPHGGRGFVLTQTAAGVDFESHLPEALPFPPEFMLQDIQRVWFRGLSGPLPDGLHRETNDGEEVVERWRGGRLLERTFRRLDGDPPGDLRATYEGGLGGDAPPEVVRFDNGWLGYTLVLTTLSFQRLDPAAD